MAALASRIPRNQPKGHDRPRIGPPVPVRSGYREFAAFSETLGIKLRPWQETVARYLTAEAPGGRWLFREVAVIVARQNGKTTVLVPLIVDRLLKGQRIMHTAQNRELPREVFGLVADIIEDKFAKELPQRGGRTIRPRFANGQEEIRLRNGGSYRIVAPTRGGARGPSNDLVIIDELREMEDFDFIAAAKPTLTASPKPQMVYLSNAGTDNSAVLNTLKRRAADDPALAYLEWSADADRSADDVEGWAESNPSLGHDPSVMETLENELRANQLGGTMSTFETEHLCRWVITMRQRLVDEFLWRDAQVEDVEKPRRPFLAVSMDPDGKQAHAAMAWRQSDDTIALRITDAAIGDPIDTDAFGKALRDMALRLGVPVVGGDPMTDKALLRYFKKAHPITGSEWLNASARFVTALEAHRIRWVDCDAVTEDLVWTARKEGSSPGTFEAVRANDDRPITAALAAVRAVWLASEMKLSAPRVF